MAKQLDEKYEELKRYLRNLGKVAVAFSGGVDSTFLLAAAKEALGDKVVAVTILSGFVPRSEVEEAAAFASSLGVRHEFVEVDELSISGVAANPPDRCYLCKKALFTKIKAGAAAKGIEQVVDGSNLDDEGDYRPGMRALSELRVASPLRIAGLSKSEIRALSQRLKLPTWDKPSFACLASRIPYGEEITREKLVMIEKAEMFLIANGFRQMRVRCHDKLARIEVQEKDFSLLFEKEMRERIDKAFAGLGFAYVAVDIKGYRTGSLNEILKA